MMWGTSFALLLTFTIFLSVLVASSSATCTSDSDCGNRGFCLPYNNVTKYCSCASGFGGDNCTSAPSAGCASSYADVNATNIQFSPNSAIAYNYPDLTVTVEAGLEETSWNQPWTGSNATLNTAPFSMDTTVVFGDGSFPECSFPGPFWVQSAAQSGDCEDKFVGQISWSDARTKCGFVDPSGNKTYTQTITVTRRYELESLRDSAPLYRTESSTRQLFVIFPTYIDISTSDVSVSGSAGLLAAITSVDYNPSTEIWTVQFLTSVQAPFKLEDPHVISVAGELLSDSRFVDSSEQIIDSVPCTNNSKNCLQQVTLSFGKGDLGDACAALNGVVVVSFNVTCSEGLGAECPATGSETSQVTLNLRTGDSCPVTDSIQFSVTTLTAFEDSALSTTRQSFLTASTAYFGAEISSLQAEISSKTIEAGSVCVVLTGNSGNSCVPVNYTTMSSRNGKDPVFSIQLSQATFASLADPSNPSIADYTVKATIRVSFTGNEKKRAATTNYPDQPVHISAQMTVSGKSSNTGSTQTTVTAQPELSAASSVSVVIGLYILALFALLL